MSDAPERILAIKLAGASKVTFLGGDTSPPFDATEYHRADAPLTPAEAMARCPEVAALVDCLAGFLIYAEGTPITRQEADDMVTNSRAALAPFTEDAGNGIAPRNGPKPGY